MACAERQPLAGRAQCEYRPFGRGPESGLGVGHAASHRHGIGRPRGQHLLGRGHHGDAHPGRVRPGHQPCVGEEHPGHTGAEPYAAAAAGPAAALGVARPRGHAQWRHHQPLGAGRAPRRHLPHRDAAVDAQHHSHVLRSLRLSAADGHVAGRRHRRHPAAVPACQPLLHLIYAAFYAEGTRLRQPGAESAHRDHATPHAGEDHGSQPSDAHALRDHPERPASVGAPPHGVQRGQQLLP